MSFIRHVQSTGEATFLADLQADETNREVNENHILRNNVSTETLTKGYEKLEADIKDQNCLVVIIWDEGKS